MRAPIGPSLVVCFLPAHAFADVERVELEAREVVADGMAFGDAGAYELLAGTIHFAFDPADPANAAVVDLDLAEPDEDGRVRASGSLVVLRPVDAAKGRRTALVEVSNRGGMAMLSYYNGAGRATRPREARDLGDGFLLRQGLTLVWVGWQFDVPDEPGRIRLDVPFVEGPTGRVRSDWVIEAPVEELDLGHRGHRAYPILDPEDPANVLTVRSGRLEPRREVPRDAWSVADATTLRLEHEPRLGDVYEFVYTSSDPALVGLGLCAIRDVASYAKYDEDSLFPVERATAMGISQTGRFLRHFLYQGFNTDELGRPVYDGLLIHTAGAGRGSFNHRFAQPSRDAHRYSAFFYPTDVYPFSGRPQRDALTGRREGLLDRVRAAGHAPRVFSTNTGYEYWGRAASLLHTSLDGSADVEPYANERIYHLSSTQHFPWGWPPRGAGEDGAWRGNPIDFLTTGRALLVAFLDWVDHDVEPPPSTHPRIDDGTLVAIGEVAWPDVPGAALPEVIHEAYRADYGARWGQGIVDLQPPVLGPAFPTLVSQVDAFGNELGGVPTVETLVPLATYAPWHVRAHPAGELTDFFGTFAPLSIDPEAAAARGDARPDVRSLYPSRDVYLDEVADAAQDLIALRWLLPEDVERVTSRAASVWDWLHAR